MKGQSFDSYTGDEYIAEYTSPLKGILTPLTMFKPHRYSRSVSVRWEAVRQGETQWLLRRVARETSGDSATESVIEREFAGSEAQAKQWLDYCLSTDRRFIRAWRTFMESSNVDWLLDWASAGEQVMGGLN